MSFKLVGDAYQQQNMVKRRRIQELFSSNIPEHEALLMKNGRYCCLVCQHRPIFDTVSMLALHRKGKKHMINANQKAFEEQSRSEEIKKRLQMGTLKEKDIEAEENKMAALQTSEPIYSAVTLRKRRPHATSANQAKKPSPGTHFLATIGDQSVSLSGDHHVTESCDSHMIDQPASAKPQEFEYVQPWNAGLSTIRERKKRDRKETQGQCTTMMQLSKYKSGWRREQNGHWVKDPNAEFDSSSEESTNE